MFGGWLLGGEEMQHLQFDARGPTVNDIHSQCEVRKGSYQKVALKTATTQPQKS